MMIRFVVLLLLSLNFFSSAAFAHSEVSVVEMTANGFEPPSVTLDENSSVIFVNKDKQPRWPASNVHPTHEIYPEFDPRKAIEPGQSWSFKPNRGGTFKYHDHLLPHIRGVLEVVSEAGSNKSPVNFWNELKKNLVNLFDKIKNLFSAPKAAAKIISSDQFIKLSAENQSAALKKIAEESGSDQGWQLIQQTFKGQAGSSGNIHDLAHLSGKLLFEKKGFAGLGSCSAQFAFGCFHGFLDSAFAKNLDHLTDAYEGCQKLAPGLSGPVASCIHGIGHGIASFYATLDIKKALSECRKLTSGKEYCFDGVFMEFVRSAQDSFFKKDDLLYPCNSLEKEFGFAYSAACGRNQPSLLMSRFRMGFDEVVQVCLNSSSKPFKAACVDALGFSLASSADTNSITLGCRKFTANTYISSCLKAAAGELVFQEAPGWEDSSKAVCQASEAVDDCLSNVDRLVKEYSRKRKINFAPIKEEDLNSYIRKSLKICFDINGRDGCYAQVAKVLYDQFGLSTTLQTLKTNEGYKEVYARCHEVTHYLSRLEYDKLKSIAKVYAQCDSTCHGGCFHGTLEAYLKEKQLAAESVEAHFVKVCGQPQDYQRDLEFNECLHGLGHAAMFVTEMELLKSLALCDRISGQKEKERCYTGVFMENSSSSTSFDHKSKYIKVDDPYYPCNSLDEKYQSLCWQYQSSYFAIIQNQDWVKVANMCLQIPQQYQDRCFRTIGTNQVGFTPVLQTMKQDCDLMPSPHFQNVCVEGVISSFAYRFVGDIGRMIEFCSLVEPQNKEACFKQMGTAFMDWTTDKEVARKNCSETPDPQGRSWCISVI